MRDFLRNKQLQPSWLSRFLNYEFVFKKLRSPFGAFFFIVTAALIGLVVSKIPFSFAVILPVGLVGLAITAICLTSPRTGFMVLFGFSFLPAIIFRLSHIRFPLGSVPDILCVIILVGFLVGRSYGMAKAKNIFNPISIALLLYTLLFAIEVLNPEKSSLSGWLLPFRKQLAFILPYFIFIQIFNHLKTFTLFLKVWIVFAILAAGYAFYQQFFGFTSFDLSYVDQETLAGLFVEGQIKRFSFLSDPSVFGIFMAISSILCFILSQGAFALEKRVLLFIIAIVCAFGLVFSGTRTAYVVLPAGIFFYLMLTIYKRNTLLLSALFFLSFIVVIFGPFYGNGAINRIRSAFIGSKDASFNVRNINRKKIQPYMHTHPIGGGLGATGGEGTKNNPGHPLAGFPPDGAYMKSALETGYVGLILCCLFYFVALKMTIRCFYRAKNEQINNYLAASASCLFGLIISQITQEAVNEIPLVIIFYTLIALPVKVLAFDTSSDASELSIHYI